MTDASVENVDRWLIRIALFSAYFVFAILLNSVGTVILQVQNSLGVTPSAAGLLEAFKDLPIAITSFLITTVITRLGYRRSMIASLLAIGGLCLVMPHVPEFWMIKLLFAATGAGFALTKVSVLAAIGLITNSHAEHTRFMNYIESFFMIGIMAGYFLFAAAVDDANPSSKNWLDIYYWVAVIAALAAVLLMFARLDETSVRDQQMESQVQAIVSATKLLARPLVLVFVISAFLYVLVEQSIMSWLPTFNSKTLNLAPSLSIQMSSILVIATALGRVGAGYLATRVAWIKLLSSGLLAAGLLVLLTLPLASSTPDAQVTSWTNAPLAAFLFPLIGFCIAPIYPTINSVVLSAVPKYQHGMMASLIVVFSALGGTAGSFITGRLFEAFGGTTAFYFSLVPLALLLVALLLLNRRFEATHTGQTPSPTEAH